MYKKLILITFWLKFVVANLTIKESIKTNEGSLLNCSIEIANKNFDYRVSTAIVHSDVEPRIVNNFIKHYQGSVIVETKKNDTPPKQVVIIVESFRSFAKIITKLKPDLQGNTFLNSGAKFLILIFSNPKRLDKIASFLWSYYVVNLVIVASERQDRIGLYTYYPYKNHLNCQNTQSTFITFCNETTKYDLYPDKMRNMQACPLYISTNKLYHKVTEQKIPLELIKKGIVRLLRDVMNFTPIISSRDYVSIESDRSKNWSDSLYDVISGTSNISISTVTLGVDKSGSMDYSIPYFRVRLAWIAPPLTPGPVWWKLLWPLNGYLWTFIMSVTFFIKSLPLVLNRQPMKRFCRRYFKKFDKLNAVALRSWGIMTGQPIRVAPRRFRDFYIISLWMWFSFVIRSAYQSVLIVALKTDTMVGKFDTLKDAVDYGYKFGGRAGILTHFEHEHYIRDGFEVIPEEKFNDVFFNVVEGKMDFVLATSLEYGWAYCLSLGLKEDSCGYVIPDSIMTVPLVIWMKNHSPFTRPIAVWLPRLIETGLLEKEAVLNPTFKTVKSSEATALTIEQTASCFLCLLLGYILAAAALVIETVWYRTRDYRPDKNRIKFTK